MTFVWFLNLILVSEEGIESSYPLNKRTRDVFTGLHRNVFDRYLYDGKIDCGRYYDLFFG